MKQIFKVWGTSIADTRDMAQPQSWNEVDTLVKTMQEVGYSDIAIKTMIDTSDKDNYVPDYFEFVGYVSKELAVYQWRVN